MQGKAVLVHGSLRGMQRQENCDVIARRRNRETGFEYVGGFIVNAPPDLPEGEYQVEFEGHKMRATKRGGHWIYSNLVVRESQ